MDFTLLAFSVTIVTPAVLIGVFKLEKAKNMIQVTASQYKNSHIIILVNDSISAKYIKQSLSHRLTHFQVSFPH